MLVILFNCIKGKISLMFFLDLIYNYYMSGTVYFLCFESQLK